MKYRGKPVIVEAEVWNGKFENGVYSFGFLIPLADREKKCPQCHRPLTEHGAIETLESQHIVCPGDWIITGVKRERYPCKPDIFEQTYELVE